MQTQHGPDAGAASIRVWLTALAPGLYPMTALVGIASLADRSVTPLALACAWATGSSVYLLDRVKPLDRLIDPADRAAAPIRFAFISANASRLRRINAILVLLSITLGFLMGWRTEAVVVAGHLAVLAYAHRPARLGDPGVGRIKDLFLVKNALVGTGMAVFGLFLMWVSTGTPLTTLIAPAVWVALLISVDAMVCDIDDVGADRAYGTATVASRVGVGAARVVGGLAYGVLLVPLMLWSADWIWWLAPLTGILLAALPVRSLRVLIDARFALVGLGAIAFSG